MSASRFTTSLSLPTYLLHMLPLFPSHPLTVSPAPLSHLLFLSFLSLQSVEERCVYVVNPENSSWTEIKREAWISSSLFGLSRAIQVSRGKAGGRT